MAECWKDISGYPGYQVSDQGRVRTHEKVTWTELHGKRHWKDRILKQKVCKDKCCRVSLWKDGEENSILVHRLVANEFIDKKIDTDLTVNHIDGNRLNNHVDNLEWVTRAKNIQLGFENGMYPMIAVTFMDEDGVYIHFRSISKASKYIGRSNNYLSKHMKKDGVVYSNDGKKYYVI